MNTRTHSALLATARKARARASQRGQTSILIVGQNAPRGLDPDGPAFPWSSDAGRRARRLWPIGLVSFDDAVRINALPTEPDRLRTPLHIGVERLHAVLDVLNGDIQAVIAAGGWAAAAVARAVGLNGSLTWNTSVVVRGGLPILAVGHPSGRNRAYNDRAFRLATAQAIEGLIIRQRGRG
ncbi:hypothetical protein [Falsiroseomonas sp. E2-1-a20]|uniref:hypothetical protein n=1 Tax=Falsiroseomonas sp. E2-1-a20 TaxID=3239300 RepID=UPI003F40534F